jgi:hypothetical protein
MATDIDWEGPTWADRVMMQGQRKTLLRQLRLRFGEVPETLVAQVQAADEATLDTMLDRVVTASSIEEFQHVSSR